MTRKILTALLLAALPATHALAGSVDLSNRAVMRGWQGGAADYYATYVGNRWQPITIHLETPVAGSLASGLAAPRRVGSGSALYNWAQGHAANSSVSAGSQFAYGWGTGHRWYMADADGEDYGVPAWHGRDHGHGHGHGGTGGGGSDDGGGVPAVPLPASLPLLLSALALLGLAMRGVGRD